MPASPGELGCDHDRCWRGDLDFDGADVAAISLGPTQAALVGADPAGAVSLTRGERDGVDERATHLGTVEGPRLRITRWPTPSVDPRSYTTSRDINA
jgi:hypothetical protein